MNCSICGAEAHLIMRGEMRFEILPACSEDVRAKLAGYVGERSETPFCAPCLVARVAESGQLVRDVEATGIGGAIIGAQVEIREH